VVTYSYGEAVEQVLSRSIGLLEDPAHLMEETDGQLFNFMQPSTEARLAKHSWHKARLLHKAASVLKVAAEVESRSKGGGNNFSIRKLASRITLMTNSFKQIVRDTVE